jgi:hypothetical protein
MHEYLTFFNKCGKMKNFQILDLINIQRKIIFTIDPNVHELFRCLLILRLYDINVLTLELQSFMCAYQKPESFYVN